MLQILDEEYSSLQPVMPEKNAVAVFNLKCAKIAFQHPRMDFVVALNEKTYKFAYCFSVKECEDFFNMINIEDYHVLLNNIVTNYRLGYITKDGAYQEIEDIENKFINGSEPDGDLAEAVSNAIDNIINS